MSVVSVLFVFLSGSLHGVFEIFVAEEILKQRKYKHDELKSERKLYLQFIYLQ